MYLPGPLHLCLSLQFYGPQDVEKDSSPRVLVQEIHEGNQITEGDLQVDIFIADITAGDKCPHFHWQMLPEQSQAFASDTYSRMSVGVSGGLKASLLALISVWVARGVMSAEEPPPLSSKSAAETTRA